MSVEDNYVQATSGMDRLVLMATDEDVMVRKEHRAAIFCDFCVLSYQNSCCVCVLLRKKKMG